MCLVSLASVVGPSAPSFATDVAFWNEYTARADDANHLHLLLQFDQEPLATRLDVSPKITVVGSPRTEPNGRFGRALALDGQSGLQCETGQTFPGGNLSIEAWAYLSSYPEKEAFLVFRPAAVDNNPAYDPKVDRSKGFSLSVDAKGALHLSTTNCFYGSTTRTSSPDGAVPLKKWVHLAATSCTFPHSFRRLFVDGKEVQAVPIAWGQGLTVSGDEELHEQPIFIGNNNHGDAGFTGLLDQVRIHRNIMKFWERQDTNWTNPQSAPGVPAAPPFFVAEHQPKLVLPLDDPSPPDPSSEAQLVLDTEHGRFVPGVRGNAFLGRIALTKTSILQAKAGSVEFWVRPEGVNNYSDRNRYFITQPFILYILNGGNAPHPLSLFFNTSDGLHFVDSPTELHPGRWRHVVITWKGNNITVYLEGHPAGNTYGVPLSPDGKQTFDRLLFNDQETIAAIDELRLYDQALLPVEVANAFHRYIDTARLVSGVVQPAADLMAEFLPSSNQLYYEATPNVDPASLATLHFELKDDEGQLLQSWDRPWHGSAEGKLDLPPLTLGDYTLFCTPRAASGQELPGSFFGFYRKPLPWEGNKLGITDQVFEPFQAINVTGSTARVVSRSMTLNGFGLWDQVDSLEKPLLAAPMRIVYHTGDGSGSWTSSNGQWTSISPAVAVHRASAKAPCVNLDATSTLQVDGCMKVEMTLSPGSTPATIRGLYLEIPLLDHEISLMHTIGDGLRSNHAGSVPAGQGTIWNGLETSRSRTWRTPFVPYIWLGAEQRGLALFAENDKGWLTAKNQEGQAPIPTHELIRDQGRLTLRAHFINKPTLLDHPTTFVFGLQASPTKPMPADWREKLPDCPGGLAVVPWGGIQCPSQGPFADDWTIVDKILEARQGKPLDLPWFQQYDQMHKPPLVHGNWNWIDSITYFAQTAKSAGPNKPIAVYQEEMMAATSRPEWIIYQDEWKPTKGPQPRQVSTSLDLAGGHRSLSESRDVTFPASYADFGTWIANEWLNRGVSLYWDNTFPRLSYNTRTTAAYTCEDGRIQPCLVIWNQRDYAHRVWNLLQLARQTRPEPLEWTLHMTNTLLLPIHTWGTINLDHELGSTTPFSPEFLRAESIGRQVGNHPLSLYAISGSDNPVIKSLPKESSDRVEWGLRAVHEIQRSGPQEKWLSDFGYGSPGVIVHNYWDESPPIRVEPQNVKWLLLERPSDHSWLCVLASWSQEQNKATLRFGASPASPPVSAETGQPIGSCQSDSLTLDLPSNWGNQVLIWKTR